MDAEAAPHPFDPLTPEEISRVGTLRPFKSRDLTPFAGGQGRTAAFRGPKAQFSSRNATGAL